MLPFLIRKQSRGQFGAAGKMLMIRITAKIILHKLNNQELKDQREKRDSSLFLWQILAEENKSKLITEVQI